MKLKLCDKTGKPCMPTSACRRYYSTKGCLFMRTVVLEREVKDD